MTSEAKRVSRLVSPHRIHDQISEALLREKFNRDRCLQLEAELAKTRSSVSFRLGNAFVEAARGTRGLRQLPSKLISILSNPATEAEPAVVSVTQVDLQVPDEPDLIAWSKGRTGEPVRLTDLRIATILDEFTHQCLEPECTLEPMPLSGFEERLDEFAPHFLLVESAWHGNAGAWRGALHHNSVPLLHLLDCCRRRGIPTVFWNKEDPVHFEHFIGIACFFDHVFTTDQDLSRKYSEHGCRKPAKLLGFFCQPSIHNPIRTDVADRIHAACFCGSWYAQYPARSNELERALELLNNRVPVDIYDRNFHRNDPAFTFPQRFVGLTKPPVPFAEVPWLYRKYRFGINMNTVTTSSSMYSRRIHELTACGTAVLTNFSPAAFEDYGDALCYLDQQDSAARLDEMLNADGRQDHVQTALRIVMTKHVARGRVAQLVEDVLGLSFEFRPKLRVLARWPADEQKLSCMLESFDSIDWPSKVLTFVGACRIDSLQNLDARSDIELLPGAAGMGSMIKGESDERWFVLGSDQPIPSNYLGNAMAATVYAPDEALGIPVSSEDVDRRNVALQPETIIFNPRGVQAEMLQRIVIEDSLWRCVSGVGVRGEFL